MEPNAAPKHQGILNLDKPPGLSSARAVSRVKWMLPRGTKIGHAGTLDPFATGVLLLLIGNATKLCEQLMDSPKQYEAIIKFGATTATDDPESPEEVTPDVVPATAERVADALTAFVGLITQRPPIFSAMKIGGRRAYDLARKGQAVKLAERTVRVDAVEMLDYAWPFLRVRIDCGRGTYIRAIARDLGAVLGVGGYLTELRRTRVGAFMAADAVTLENLKPEDLSRHLRQWKPGSENIMPDRSLIDNYESGAGKVSQAIQELNRENLLAFPVPGTWSIQQIVLHLADSEQVFADRMKRVIAEENSTLLAYDENKWTSGLHYDAQSAADAATTIELTRKQMGRLLRALPESAFDRKGTHSVTGPVSLRELVAKATGHLEHHLKFIVEKRAKLGK